MSKLETKKSNELTEFVGIKMTAAMKADLRDLADKDRRDFSNYVRVILENFIERAKKGKKV